MANTIDEIGDIATLDGLISHTLEEFEDDKIMLTSKYAFCYNDYIKKVSLPSLTGMGSYSFIGCNKLENITIGNVSTIPTSAFSGCIHLRTLNMPHGTLSTIDSYAFQDCISLDDIDSSNVSIIEPSAFSGSCVRKMTLPKVLTLSNNAFSNSPIGVLDIGETYKKTITNNINGTYFLCHLIIRANSIIKLLSSSTLNSVGSFVNGVGWIYVPSDLVDEYKSATNWSNFSNQIVSIDEYPKPLQNETISDSWDDIILSANNGTYSDKYNIGDIKYCNIGGTYIPMEIVAFNTDALEDGGVAPITFISRCCLESVAFNDGGHAEWGDCDLRKRMRNIIYPQIESPVKNAIKPVVKTYLGSDRTLLSSIDNIWIPSLKEMLNSGESDGVYYNANKINKKKGLSDSLTNYWLRTSMDTNHYFISAAGGYSNNIDVTAMNVAFGFCI